MTTRRTLPAQTRIYKDSRLKLRGLVYELAAGCDVLLNLRKPIELMCDGELPFKVIEYVASERLVIPTSMREANLTAAFESIVVAEHDKPSIVSVLNAVWQIYEHRRARIGTVVADVQCRFGKQRLSQTVT